MAGRRSIWGDRTTAPRIARERVKGFLSRSTRSRIRFFSSPSRAERARRPTDFVLLAGAFLVVVTAAILERNSASAGNAVAAFAQSLPGLFGWFWEICDVAIVIWMFVLLTASVVGRGRLGLLRDQVVAAAIALSSGGLLTTEGVSVWSALTASGPSPVFPGLRLSMATAVVATTSPHLGRPIRRIGRWLIPLASVADIATGVATPVGIVVGLGLGYGAAALVHLLFGSPGGRPTVDDVAESLASLGADVRELHPAALAARGVASMEATTSEDRPLLVKVYGRDAWDGQLLTVTWSYLWYRDDTPDLRLSRLQQVEHEAFVTLLAERADVSVEPVIAAGMSDDDAILVLGRRGRFLLEVGDEAITDDVLRDLWKSVTLMHGAGIAHGALDAGHIRLLDEGNVVIGGFEVATAAASGTQIESDRAHLLAVTALRVGPSRAIRSALEAIGPDGLAGCLPCLQGAALTRATRQAIKRADLELDSLRAEAAASAGSEPPKLQPLRRVTWGTVLVAALIVFAFGAVFSALTDVGVQTITNEFASAQLGWLWAALLISPLSQVAEAFSTIGACPRPLRLGPVIGLQFAIRFIALAVPSSAARVALNVRFFQRAGLATSPAIAVGLVDSLAGFIVQILLLVVIWAAGLATLSLSTSGVDLDISPETIVGLVIVVVAVVALAVSVPRVRRVIGPRLAEATEALQVLTAPTKVLELFAGNLVAQLILASVLGLCLRALGQQASLAELLVVNTLASLFAGIMPIPGGIGVQEAAISFGLSAIGIPESTAVSAAIAYRLITFYLPPIWGAFAMRVLRNHEYI